MSEELKEEIVNLKNRIEALEKDLNFQIEQNHNNTKMWNAILEIQEFLSTNEQWFVHKL
jgi:hypothetical protein